MIATLWVRSCGASLLCLLMRSEAYAASLVWVSARVLFAEVNRSESWFKLGCRPHLSALLQRTRVSSPWDARLFIFNMRSLPSYVVVGRMSPALYLTSRPISRRCILDALLQVGAYATVRLCVCPCPARTIRSAWSSGLAAEVSVPCSRDTGCRACASGCPFMSYIPEVRK